MLKLPPEFRRSLLFLQETYASILSPNRAVSRSNLSDFWTQAYAVHATTPYDGKLDFRTLAVLPEYQRQGIGEKLLEWAGGRARQEAIPIFGDATEKGRKLYLRKGAKEIGRVILQERTVERGAKSGLVKLPRLETPVMRWDASCLSLEDLIKISPKA